MTCFRFFFFSVNKLLYHPIFVVSVAVELVVESFRLKPLANSFRIRWTVELPSAPEVDCLELEVAVAVVGAVEQVNLLGDIDKKTVKVRSF